MIHGAVLETLTADETSGGGAATWAALWQVGEILVFTFRRTTTALDDFTRRHLWLPPESFLLCGPCQLSPLHVQPRAPGLDLILSIVRIMRAEW